MRIAPIAIIAGLGAVAAAVMYSRSSQAAGGPGLQPDPQDPFDCAGTLAALKQMQAAIDAGTAKCKTNPTDPVCASLAGWRVDYQAILADFSTHHCDNPGIDCAAQAAQLKVMQDQIASTIKSCEVNPSLPACAAVPAWQANMQPMLDSWHQACGGSATAAKAECDQISAWIAAVTPSIQALSDACHNQGSPQACASYNSLVGQLYGAQGDLAAHCGG